MINSRRLSEGVRLPPSGDESLTDVESRLLALIRTQADVEKFSINIKRDGHRFYVFLRDHDAEQEGRLGAGDGFEDAFLAAGGL